MNKPKLELVHPEKPRRARSSRSSIDPETKRLRAVLLGRDRLREQMAASDRELKEALRIWSDTRPGERGGIASEAGARFLLGRAGLL
jgi:hypothetical protein